MRAPVFEEGQLLEQRLEGFPERRLGDESDDERGDRDPQLGARQLERQRTESFDGAESPPATFLGLRLDP